MTLQMEKIYSATTSIKIDQSIPQVFKTQSGQTAQWSDDTLETELELLRSRAVAERVATALRLAQSDFIREEKPSLLSRLLGGGSSAKPSPPVTDPEAIEARREWAAGLVMGGLSVKPVGQLIMINLSTRALVLLAYRS